MRAQLLWMIGVALAGASHLASADDKSVECSYLELSGTTAEKPSMDPDLKPLEKKLTKPPFSAWNAMRKLSSGAVHLTRNKAEQLKLKEGAASILLRERNEKRLELGVTMDGADGKRVLDVKQGVTVGDYALFVATNAKGDGHILALTCK